MGLPLRLLCSICTGVFVGYVGFLVVGNVYWYFTQDTEATVSSVGRLYGVGLLGGACFFLVSAVLMFRALK
jgi:hypothetical protein